MLRVAHYWWETLSAWKLSSCGACVIENMLYSSDMYFVVCKLSSGGKDASEYKIRIFHTSVAEQGFKISGTYTTQHNLGICVMTVFWRTCVVTTELALDCIHAILPRLFSREYISTCEKCMLQMLLSICGRYSLDHRISRVEQVPLRTGSVEVACL